MDTIRAEQGLRLSYLRYPSRSEAFDPCRILDDVCQDGTTGAMLPWQNGLRMAESDHLVVAAGANDGRCFGVLAATDLATEREPFLFLDAAYLTRAARASNLLQRMLAFTVLRVAGNAAVPNVIAACVQTPCYASSLFDFAQRFATASMYPVTPDAVVIDLGMASLARRILRTVRPTSCHAAAGMSRYAAGAAHHQAGISRMEEMLVVVDLGTADDATILDEARKLYRARQRNGARRGFGDAIADDTMQPRRQLSDATAV